MTSERVSLQYRKQWLYSSAAVAWQKLPEGEYHGAHWA
jgi:hypothetical protein